MSIHRLTGYFEQRADEQAMTIPVVLSTEYPVDRGIYEEVLSHRPGDVDLSRANPMPMLKSHDQSELPIGVIENVRIVGDSLRGLARFSERARDLFKDVKEGILRGVSIGYSLLDDGTPVGGRTRRFKFLPFEASLVALPADPTAGFNRGKSMNALRQYADNQLLEQLDGARELARARIHGAGPALSLGNVLLSMARKSKLTSREREICEAAIPKNSDLGPILHENRMYIPLSLLGVRAMATTPGGKGGYLLDSETLSAVDVLRPWSVVASAGVTMVDGLEGSVPIPRVTTAVSASWIGENQTAANETSPTLGEASLKERTAIVLTKFSLQLLRQAPAATEALVRAQLLAAIGEALDLAFFAGTGGTQPQGLLQVTGIGTQSGTSLAHAGLLAMRQKVLTAGGREDGLQWVGTPAVQELLGARERATGGGRFLWDDNGILGKPAHATKNAVASALVVGDFSRAIAGIFGPGIRIDVDPTQGFNTGEMVARVLFMCDLAFPQPAAFTVATSVT